MRKIAKVRDSDAYGKPNIKEEDFFHGFLPEVHTDSYLSNIGDFLVRQVAKSNIESFVISLRVEPAVGAKSIIRHVPIVYSRRHKIYYVHQFGFSQASGLIDYHRRKAEPVDELGAKIIKPIKRANWQFNHEQITRIRKLGDGAFGDVSLGYVQRGFIFKTQVAVKTVHGSVTIEENCKLYEEAMLMRLLQNTNVIKFYGIASNEDPIMIIIELAPRGSIESAVKTGKPSEIERIYWSLGACRGLEYLHSVNILHRDVAARNVLIGRHSEAKISDFGLSLVGMEKREHKLKKVPFRYLAPETLKSGIYNEKTDVWSYGVFVWEVFHNAEEPYVEYASVLDVKKLVIKNKLRLQNKVGDSFPPKLWEITQSCFTTEPKERPAFSNLVISVEAFWKVLNQDTCKAKLQRFLRVKKAPIVVDSVDVESAKSSNSQEPSLQ